MFFECETCKVQFKLKFHIENHMKTKKHLSKTKNIEYKRNLR
jgi:hypothetical protein